MKRAVSPIHWLATASNSTTFVMASRPNHRGRGRGRGFLPRTYSDGRGHFVTGDSHFQSISYDNLGLRRRGGRSLPNQMLYQSPSFYPRHPPPYLQSPQFRYLPPFNQTHWFRPPPPHDQKSAYRPRQPLRPRPPNYRDWEYATTPPHPDCERFIVLSYNILADYLANDHWRKLYFHIPPYMLDWQWRKRNLLIELGQWSADIMCLQEVDMFDDLEEEFKLQGYSGIWKMRTGNPVDGCAIFWRTSRFKLLYKECIEFNKLGLRDNVAQICVLELINQKGALPSSLTGPCKVVICNIHVLYNPKRGEIKLGQVRVLLDRAKAASKSWNDAPVVICGDFNCTPKSPLYNFISEQKLYLSGVDRYKVSGQASAVIRVPSEISTHGSVKGSSAMGNKEVNVEPSNRLSDMQNLDNQANNVEDRRTDNVLDVGFSDRSLTNVQHGKESGTLYDAGKDTQLNANSVYAETSLWTPTEIETATGNAECTVLEHQLPLRSTYTEVMGCSGTRDSSGEPLVTTYNRCFLGTVDYIWRSEGLQTTRVLAPIPKHAMDWTPGFPTKKWGSDHIALVSELAFLKDGNNGRDVQ